MSAKKIILFVLGGFALVFGFLYLLGSGGAGGGGSTWLMIGAGLVIIGLILIFLATKIAPPQPADVNVTYQVDIPGDVNMEKIKCVSCGGTIGQKDINMVNGAPVVTCPWCNTTYQLTEEPKW